MPCCIVCGRKDECPKEDEQATNKPDESAKISFHKFPVKENLRAQWVKALGRENWSPPKYSKICSVHFAEEDLDKTFPFATKLKPGAVPQVKPGPAPKLLNGQPSAVPQYPALHLRNTVIQFPNLESVEILPPDVNYVLWRTTPEHPIIPPLRPVQTNNDNSQLSKAEANLKLLNCKLARAQKKINQQTYLTRTLKLKLQQYETIVKSLMQKIKDNETIKLKLMSAQVQHKCNFSAEWQYTMKGMSPIMACMLQRELTKKSNPNAKQFYNNHVKGFALALDHLSPEAYTFVRKSFGTFLPHPKTIKKWISQRDDEDDEDEVIVIEDDDDEYMQEGNEYAKASNNNIDENEASVMY